jgi:dihydroxy-acid dehydratase
MEDFFFAGGMGAVLRELRPLLHLDTISVTGETLGDRLETDDGYIDTRVIARAQEPLEPEGGLIALFGNLAPNGAIFKRAAADKNLFEAEGRAVVFSSLEDLAARVDDPDLDISSDDFMVLQNAGPKSDSGMPEAGYLPIPKKLSKLGVKDMVRISDARMSGTAFGTIVLHVSPEAAIGGPLSLVRNGDRIRISVSNKRIDLLVDEKELNKRRSEWVSDLEEPENLRGYNKLYATEVTQAEQGCDFEFLKPVKR